MNKDLLIKAGIDYNGGLERFVGKASLYEEYIFKYLDDTNFETLKTAMENGDYNTAFICAHTLKGTTGNLSFNVFMKKLIPFVEALRNESDIPKAKELLPGLIKEHEFLIQTIKEQENE